MTEQAAPKCRACGGTNLIKNGHYGAAADHPGREGQQKWKCKDCGWQGDAVLPLETEGINRRRVDSLSARIQKRVGQGDITIVVTAAQNATPLHHNAFQSLRQYCRRNKAFMAVIPFRYHNPTSVWTDKDKAGDWWAPELAPYLLDYDAVLHPHLILMGSYKMQPTAVNPLEGLESVSGGRSAIFGHPKLELKTVPTPQDTLPKILTTTGAITRKNYSPTKAGKKGEFHHTYGATVIEIKDGLFHMRQINMVEDGSFTDLDINYEPDGWTKAAPALALVMGDTHQEFVDPEVVSATFRKGGIVDALKPQHLVWHDVHDFYSRTHHHDHDPYLNYGKYLSGRDDVEKALRGTFSFMDDVTPPGTINVVVRSNHGDQLLRWLQDANPKKDPRNTLFWHRTSIAMLERTMDGPEGVQTIDPFAYWGRQWLKCADRTRFLAYDESFRLGGIELTYHGHKGPGGSRGSRNSYRRIGSKTIIGHGHGPGISEGCYQVGHNRLKAAFEAGAPSATLTTDCVIYANGKRSLINIVRGQWRG